ncbi:MAG: hypothetical protein HC837_11805 [Chloroflexaceae bacterium]|nr:hypothetical protein [Chloroflexaceae bacterium]
MLNQPGYQTETNIAHPYAEAIIVVGLFSGVFALVTAALGGLVLAGWLLAGWLFPALINLAFWVLMLITIWLWGLRKQAQIRAFLQSSRPLIRWWYTPEEWSQIKAEEAQEQREILTVAPGCLALLFGLVGLLVGAAIGAEDSLADALINGALGLAIGAALGGMLGATVAAGTYLASRWVQQYDRQLCVALGPTEVLYGRSYFRSNGLTCTIERVTLHDQELELELYNPKPRGGSEETWVIPVPERMLDPLQRVIPQIRTGKERDIC